MLSVLSTMSAITVLYFAGLRELTRRTEEQLELPAEISTVKDLIEHLGRSRPELSGRFASVRVAINESFVGPEHALHPGDVVALIPPVAGG